MKTKNVLPVLLFLVCAMAVSAQWVNVDPLHQRFATDRIKTFAIALEENDVMTLFRMIDPYHILMNAAYLDEFSLDDPDDVDFAVCNWGIMAAAGSPFLNSVERITRVTGYFVDTSRSLWEVFFEVELDDGSSGSYSTFMDPETLLMFGAAG